MAKFLIGLGFFVGVSLCYSGTQIQVCVRPLDLALERLMDDAGVSRTSRSSQESLPQEDLLSRNYAADSSLRHCFFALANAEGVFEKTVGYFGDANVRAEYPRALTNYKQQTECETIIVEYAAGDSRVINAWEQIMNLMNDEGKISYNVATHNCCSAVKNTCDTLGLLFPYEVYKLNYGIGITNCRKCEVL